MSNPALAKLRDIHLPDPIGWWPLAIGWQLLLLFLITAVIFFGYILYRYRYNSRPKKEALHLLRNYRQIYEQTGNSQQACAQVAELLKRVSLAYFPRETVSGLVGEEWLKFLKNSSKKIEFEPIRELLLTAPYQTGNQQVNLTLLFSSAKSWIKQRRKRCSN